MLQKIDLSVFCSHHLLMCEKHETLHEISSTGSDTRCQNTQSIQHTICSRRVSAIHCILDYLVFYPTIFKDNSSFHKIEFDESLLIITGLESNFKHKFLRYICFGNAEIHANSASSLLFLKISTSEKIVLEVCMLTRAMKHEICFAMPTGKVI